MKALFTKSLFTYVIVIFLIVALAGGVLSLIVTNYIVLISVLLILYFIFIIVLLNIFDKYIKPIEKTSNMITELVNGNYRARIHHPSNGSIGLLSNKVNKLARNLSELSVHEQIQSEQLSTVIDNTESGLVLIDEKGYIHLVNRKFISMFGRTSKDYIGHLYYDVLEKEKIHETVQETFLYEKNVKGAFTYKEGIETYYLEIVGAPIFNERGRLKGAVLVLYDITEFKNLELMRKDFVANVSHELRTPITSIRGFAETLADGAMDEKETREEFVGIIYEESKRLQLLIDDLLILSRLEQEEVRLSLSTINMNMLLDDIIPMISHQAEKSDIKFTVQVKETLELTGDSDKLKQVLINLLTNAINYTPGKGEVILLMDQTDEHVQIQIKDTGIGMDKKQLPRIFERFYRVDKARSRNTGGTGLGLAIVKHIIEVHNGSISVDSKLNEGTTFTIQLPKNS